MRTYLCYRALLLCTLLLSTITQAQVQKIYINPKAPGGGKQSQFVDSIRFIPLQVKEGIEPGGYNNVSITKHHFYITDYPTKSLFLYAKDGRFIKKISYKKLGTTFYPSSNANTDRIVFLGDNKNYTLTPKDRLQITLDWSNPRNKKYFKKYTIDLADTSFTLRKETPSENDIVHAFPFYDDLYGQGEIMTSPLFKDSLDYEFKIYRNHQLVKGFFPYNRISEPRFLYAHESTEISSTDNPSVHLLTRPFCDTIYKMHKDSLFPAYQVVLPLENTLPPSFFKKPFKNNTERENFSRNNGWMLHQVYNFYETPRYFFFLVSYLSNYEYYLYQKGTNAAYKVKNIKPDSSQYNLALLADFNVRREGDRFYKSLKAGDLLAFFEQTKGVAVPKELESYLKSNPPKTAPVIVEFKLKN